MKIDKGYLKNFLEIIESNQRHKVQMIEIGLKIGIMTGMLSDPASIKIERAQIDKFLGHLKYLEDAGHISCNDPNFGRTLSILNISISPLIYYEITPMGHFFLDHLKQTPFKKILTKMLEASGKLIWIFVGGLIGGVGTYVATLILGACK